MQLEGLDQLLGLDVEQRELLDDGVAQKRLAAQVAGYRWRPKRRAAATAASCARSISSTESCIRRRACSCAYRARAHASCSAEGSRR